MLLGPILVGVVLSAAIFAGVLVGLLFLIRDSLPFDVSAKMLVIVWVGLTIGLAVLAPELVFNLVNNLIP